MRWTVLPLFCLLAFLMAACAAQPLPSPDWSYEKDAIQIRLRADANLNLDDGAPHTLVLCAYQLKDPNTLNHLAEDSDGIYKLLSCTLFDGSVATARQLVVHPGTDMTVQLDRAAGAQYVAMVAGYYVLQKERMIRLYDIPVVVEEKGIFRRTRTARPGPMTIDLTLGPMQIEQEK